MTYAHPYTIKLWYPSNVVEGSATYSVTIKAPELGNTNQVARNQQFQRTRAGRTLVYDRGRNINEILHLEFKDIPDSEKAALIVFLDLVGWGAVKLKYKDFFGNLKVVRCLSNQIEYTDFGLQNKLSGGSPSPGVNEVLFSFNLDILDLTNSPEEFEIDTAMSNQLALHIADLNHPHNPKTTTTVNIVDGAKVLESILVDDYKTVIWTCAATNGALTKNVLVSATHNGTAVADATLTNSSETIVAAIGDTSPISFSVSLSGTGAAQAMRLIGTTTTDGWTVSFRRIKV